MNAAGFEKNYIVDVVLGFWVWIQCEPHPKNSHMLGFKSTLVKRTLLMMVCFGALSSGELIRTSDSKIRECSYSVA